MKQIKCPVCDRRVCDSNISLQIAKLSKNNMNDADIVMKCKNCKSCVAINIKEEDTTSYST